jgi:prophage maintenance system killer protein
VTDVPTLAAAYAFGIVRNHPFAAWLNARSRLR